MSETVGVRRWLTSASVRTLRVCKRCGHASSHVVSAGGCLYPGCRCEGGGPFTGDPEVQRLEITAVRVVDDPTRLRQIQADIQRYRVMYDAQVKLEPRGHQLPIARGEFVQILDHLNYLLNGEWVPPAVEAGDPVAAEKEGSEPS